MRLLVCCFLKFNTSAAWDIVWREYIDEQTDSAVATTQAGSVDDLLKPGHEEEEQPPKSPSQNQHRSC